MLLLRLRHPLINAPGLTPSRIHTLLTMNRATHLLGSLVVAVFEGHSRVLNGYEFDGPNHSNLVMFRRLQTVEDV